MSLMQEEIRNFSFKGWQGILGTGNRSTAPDNSTYYEEAFANNVSIDGSAVLTQLNLVPPAANQAEADTAVAVNSTVMRGFGTPTDPTNAIHLTPTLNHKSFMCTSTYGDMNTRLNNFIQPQMVQNGNFASIGYTARLYNGNPNAGGVEIPTTVDQIGANVGWFFMYGAGSVIVSSSFSGIIDATDVWLVCYQYIGQTAASQSSTPISAAVRIMMDKVDSYTNFLNPKMSPKSIHIAGNFDHGRPNNTGNVVIPQGTNLYLADVTIINEYEYNAIYRGFNSGDGYEMTIPKSFPKEFYLQGLGFGRDEDLAALGYEVEIWYTQDTKTSLRGGDQSHGNGRYMNQVPHSPFTRNLFTLDNLIAGSGGLRYGKLHIKIRDLNQGVEAWMQQEISIKKIPIVTTDSSLSADFGHGHVVSARVV